MLLNRKINQFPIKNCKMPLHFARYVVLFQFGSDAFAAEGETILTVHGQKNGEAVVMELSLEHLEAYPQLCFKSKNEWVPQDAEYCGPLFKTLVDDWAIEGTSIVTEALNRYSASLDIEKTVAKEAIFALKRNGKYLTSRDKGPIWIVFNTEKFPDTTEKEYRRYWVWQLAELKFTTQSR